MGNGQSATNPPLFGIGLLPSAQDSHRTLALAQLADEAQLDFVSVQDHPYNPTFLDTWTLLSLIGALTQHVHLVPDVLNLPLRPPAMLAKATASLDILTGGRVEMGLGAGGFWDAIASYGGPRRTPGESVEALEEAVFIMRALWGSADTPLTFEGRYYRLEAAQAGPHPLHPMPIWLGANKPRMLRLTGSIADGLIVSSPYMPPDDLPAVNDLVDEGAVLAGRDPASIRRGYNLAGVIVPSDSPTNLRPRRPGVIIGTVQTWVDEILRYYSQYRMDTFHFMAVGGNSEAQVRAYAEQVVPAVWEAIARG